MAEWWENLSYYLPEQLGKRAGRNLLGNIQSFPWPETLSGYLPEQLGKKVGRYLFEDFQAGPTNFEEGANYILKGLQGGGAFLPGGGMAGVLKSKMIRSALTEAAPPLRTPVSKVAPELKTIPAVEPVPEMVRLYRAETGVLPGEKKGIPDWVKESEGYKGTKEATGRWFSETPEAAKYYQDKFGEGQPITYVDIPKSDLEKYRASNIPEGRYSAAGRAKEEFFLPKEIASQRKTVLLRTPVPRVAPELKTVPVVSKILAPEPRNIQLRHYTGSELEKGIPTKGDKNNLVWFTEGESYLTAPPKTEGKYGYVSMDFPSNKVLRIDETPGMLDKYLNSKFGRLGRSKENEMNFAESLGYSALKRGNDVSMRTETAKIISQKIITPEPWDITKMEVPSGGIKEPWKMTKGEFGEGWDKIHNASIEEGKLEIGGLSSTSRHKKIYDPQMLRYRPELFDEQGWTDPKGKIFVSIRDLEKAGGDMHKAFVDKAQVPKPFIEETGRISSTVPSTKKVETNYSNWFKQKLEDARSESHGQDILDTLDAKRILPGDVHETFWKDTYWKLDAEQQNYFKKYARKLFNEDDPIEISKFARGESPLKHDQLEGSERGYWAMMDEANRVTKSSSSISPQIAKVTPELKTVPSTTKPTPNIGDFVEFDYQGKTIQGKIRDVDEYGKTAWVMNSDPTTPKMGDNQTTVVNLANIRPYKK